MWVCCGPITAAHTVQNSAGRTTPFVAEGPAIAGRAGVAHLSGLCGTPDCCTARSMQDDLGRSWGMLVCALCRSLDGCLAGLVLIVLARTCGLSMVLQHHCTVCDSSSLCCRLQAAHCRPMCVVPQLWDAAAAAALHPPGWLAAAGPAVCCWSQLHRSTPLFGRGRSLHNMDSTPCPCVRQAC